MYRLFIMVMVIVHPEEMNKHQPRSIFFIPVLDQTDFPHWICGLLFTSADVYVCIHYYISHIVLYKRYRFFSLCVSWVFFNGVEL